MNARDWNAVSTAVERLSNAVYFELGERECVDAEPHVTRIVDAARRHAPVALHDAVEDARDFVTFQVDDEDARKYLIIALDDVLAAVDW